MNCLCCGKPLKIEDKCQWHKNCIKKFFGTTDFPDIEIDEKTLEKIALFDIEHGLTVPGVQKKLSLHLSTLPTSRLTLVDYPTGYILKPQVTNFSHMPEIEHLAMLMAEKVGISTVPHALIKKGNEYAYITKRIDRIIQGDRVEKIAMEDFCQLDLRLTIDKYKGSYERCAKLIQKYSFQAGLDLSELFLRLLFSFLIGNSDMHLKNFSLIKKENGYVLSKAYDILPVNVVMPEDKEEFALPMNGKKRNLRKKDFFAFAEECNLPFKAVEKMIKKLIMEKETLINMVKESLLSMDEKERMIQLMLERYQVLES